MDAPQLTRVDGVEVEIRGGLGVAEAARLGERLSGYLALRARFG